MMRPSPRCAARTASTSSARRCAPSRGPTARCAPGGEAIATPPAAYFLSDSIYRLSIRIQGRVIVTSPPGARHAALHLRRPHGPRGGPALRRPAAPRLAAARTLSVRPPEACGCMASPLSAVYQKAQGLYGAAVRACAGAAWPDCQKRQFLARAVPAGADATSAAVAADLTAAGFRSESDPAVDGGARSHCRFALLSMSSRALHSTFTNIFGTSISTVCVGAKC